MPSSGVPRPQALKSTSIDHCRYGLQPFADLPPMEQLTGLEAVLSITPSPLASKQPPLPHPWKTDPSPPIDEAYEDVEPLPQSLDPTDWDEDGGNKASKSPSTSSSSSSTNPTTWSVEVAQGVFNVKIDTDRRTVHYVGKANHELDFGSVKADRPLPHRQSVYYFEVEVLVGPERASVCLGVAAKGCPMNRQLGTTPHSYGMRATDGRLFANGVSSPRGRDYGPSAGKGDVLGCGINFAKQHIFYTKNGKSLGVAFRDIFRRRGCSSGSDTPHSPLMSRHGGSGGGSTGGGSGGGSVGRSGSRASASLLLSRSRAPDAMAARFRAARALMRSSIPLEAEGESDSWRTASGSGSDGAGGDGGGEAERRGSGGPDRSQHRTPVRVQTKLTRTPELEFYPIVSLHAPGEAVRVNMGQDPFRFDIEAYKAEDDRRWDASLQSVVVTPSRVRALVRDYLLTAGYRDTLKVFDSATTSSVEVEMESKEEAMICEQPGAEHRDQRSEPLEHACACRRRKLDSTLEDRAVIRQALMRGDVRWVVKKLNEAYPDTLRHHGVLRFELRCLEFVQLVRDGKLVEAVMLARTELSPFAMGSPQADYVTKVPIATKTVNGKEQLSHGHVVDGEDGMDVDVPLEEALGNGHDVECGRRVRRKRGGEGGWDGERLGCRRLDVGEPTPFEYAMRLRDVMGLIACRDVESSPLAHLASRRHIEDLVELVTSAILDAGDGVSAGKSLSVIASVSPSRSLLEHAIAQLVAVQEALREQDADGRGEPFKLPQHNL